MLRSAIVLFCMVALVNAGSLRAPGAAPANAPESEVLNKAAEVTNTAARVPLPQGGPHGMTRGGYVPKWSHDVLNNNVKTV